MPKSDRPYWSSEADPTSHWSPSGLAASSSNLLFLTRNKMRKICNFCWWTKVVWKGKFCFEQPIRSQTRQHDKKRTRRNVTLFESQMFLRRMFARVYKLSSKMGNFCKFIFDIYILFPKLPHPVSSQSVIRSRAAAPDCVKILSWCTGYLLIYGVAYKIGTKYLNTHVPLEGILDPNVGKLLVCFQDQYESQTSQPPLIVCCRLDIWPDQWLRAKLPNFDRAVNWTCLCRQNWVECALGNSLGCVGWQ